VRWSCAALALTLVVLAQIKVSRETVRLELKAAGYVWKRAKLKGRTRRRLRTLAVDVEEHLAENGQWQYRLSEIYYTLEVDLEVDVLRIRATFG